MFSLSEPQEDNLWLFDHYTKNVASFNVKKYEFRTYSIDVKINNAQYLNDTVYIFNTERGLYSFDFEKKKFYSSTILLNKFLKNINVKEIIDTKKDDYYVYSYKNGVPKLYKIYKIGNTLIVDSSIFNVFNIFSKVRFVDNNLWILTYGHFLRYNNLPIKKNINIEPVFYKILTKDGKLLYSYGQSLKEIKLDNKQNSLIVEFSLPSYIINGRAQFSYKLDINGKGDWSQWSMDTRVALLSLPSGKYTFYLKARDALGRESKLVSFSFSISPPFYKSFLAYVFYILIVVFLLYLIFKIRERSLIREKEKLEKKNAQKTYELEKQKQEISKQKENLKEVYEQLKEKDIELRRLIEELQLTNQKIVKLNKNITNGIEYSKRIQKSILSHQQILNDFFKEWFVFYEPKEFVSGDLYWAKVANKKLYIAVIDCTGHGIPAAFMNIFIYSLLNQLIYKGVSSTSDFLEKLRYEYIQIYSYGQIRKVSLDEGFDISLVSIDLATSVLEFSGVFNSLIVIQKNGKFIEIKGERFSITYMRELKPFTTKLYHLSDGDKLYMFTDGYYDQINPKTGHKYYRKNFYRFLQKIYALPMDSQYSILKEEFYSWRGHNIQLDDVLVLGLKIDMEYLKHNKKDE